MVSSQGTTLDAELAQSRTATLELCNTGPGAEQVRQRWEELGFAERSDMSLLEAFIYSADYAYSDPQAVVDYGTFSFPTISVVAENCQEALVLITSPTESYQPTTAIPVVEEFRESGDLTAVLDQLFAVTR